MQLAARMALAMARIGRRGVRGFIESAPGKRKSRRDRPEIWLSTTNDRQSAPILGAQLLPSTVDPSVEGRVDDPGPMPSCTAAGWNDQREPLGSSTRPPRFSSAAIDRSISDERARAEFARYDARKPTGSTAANHKVDRAVGQPARRRMEDRRLAPGRSGRRSFDRPGPTRHDRYDRQDAQIAPAVEVVGVGKDRRGRRGVLAGATRARARRGSLRDFARLRFAGRIGWERG